MIFVLILSNLPLIIEVCAPPILFSYRGLCPQFARLSACKQSLRVWLVRLAAKRRSRFLTTAARP